MPVLVHEESDNSTPRGGHELPFLAPRLSSIAKSQIGVVVHASGSGRARDQSKAVICLLAGPIPAATRP